MSSTPRAPWLPLVLFALLIVGLGGLGGVAFSGGGQTWYQGLQRPPGTPSPWVFGPVWTLIYAMMGVSLGLLVKARRLPTAQSAIRVFILQLFLNLAWTPLFFGAHRSGLALLDILLLWLAIAWTIVLARKVSRIAAWLLLPYLAWVSYATYLNAGFWWLNR